MMNVCYFCIKKKESGLEKSLHYSDDMAKKVPGFFT